MAFTYLKVKSAKCLCLSDGRGRGVGVRWGINIEKSEGVGCGEGLCSPQFGVWGLPPEKKLNFALKSMQF